jgi:hypothetical protein
MVSNQPTNLQQLLSQLQKPLSHHIHQINQRNHSRVMVIQGARHHPSRRLRPQKSRLLQRVHPRKDPDSVKEPVWLPIEWFSLRFLLILQSLQLNSLLAVRFFQMGPTNPRTQYRTAIQPLPLPIPHGSSSLTMLSSCPLAYGFFASPCNTSLTNCSKLIGLKSGYSSLVSKYPKYFAFTGQLSSLTNLL